MLIKYLLQTFSHLLFLHLHFVPGNVTMAYVVTDSNRVAASVYIPLTACTTADCKAHEVMDVVKGIPFGVRSLTLDIEVCFGVDDYPREADEWMDAMIPLRRVVEGRGDLEYLELKKQGWRNHLIFEAILWSARENERIKSIKLVRLLLPTSMVSDWMCKSTQVNEFKFDYVSYSAPPQENVKLDSLQHKKVLCWWSTIRHILLWSFFCCTPFLLMLLFPTTTEGGWEHGASTGVSVLASRWTGVSN